MHAFIHSMVHPSIHSMPSFRRVTVAQFRKVACIRPCFGTRLAEAQHLRLTHRVIKHWWANKWQQQSPLYDASTFKASFSWRSLLHSSWRTWNLLSSALFFLHSFIYSTCIRKAQSEKLGQESCLSQEASCDQCKVLVQPWMVSSAVWSLPASESQLVLADHLSGCRCQSKGFLTGVRH